MYKLKSGYIFTNSINWSMLVMKIQRVFCAVETEQLNII
jgi:hypothetical protein